MQSKGRKGKNGKLSAYLASTTLRNKPLKNRYFG